MEHYGQHGTEYPLTSACFYWANNKFNEAADKDDIRLVIKKMSGGFAGADPIIKTYELAKATLSIH